MGQRLIGALLESDRWVINGDHVSIESLCVIDRVIPEHFRSRGIETIEGDLLSIIRKRHEIFEGVDAVIHLASAVSGECEADLELGLKVLASHPELVVLLLGDTKGGLVAMSLGHVELILVLEILDGVLLLLALSLGLG